jgi:hypothetical protein
MVTRSTICILILVDFVLLLGCGDGLKVLDLSGWKKLETLWTSPTGTAVVSLYDRPTALSENPQAIVCESGTSGAAQRHMITVLPRYTDLKIYGHTLNVYGPKIGAGPPGWYRIERNHELSWWQRTFSNKTLGTWGPSEAPSDIEMPPPSTLHGGVFVVRNGRLNKIMDESGLDELWDVPAEGLVYVAEPGVGVWKSLDLNTECH